MYICIYVCVCIHTYTTFVHRMNQIVSPLHECVCVCVTNIHSWLLSYTVRDAYEYIFVSCRVRDACTYIVYSNIVTHVPWMRQAVGEGSRFSSSIESKSASSAVGSFSVIINRLRWCMYITNYLSLTKMSTPRHTALQHTATQCNDVCESRTVWVANDVWVTNYPSRTIYESRISDPTVTCGSRTIRVANNIWVTNYPSRTIHESRTNDLSVICESRTIWVANNIWVTKPFELHDTLRYTATRCINH